MATVTRELYQLLDEAYTFFNQQLFAGILPSVAITLRRYQLAYGYFHIQQFQSRGGQLSGEIVLNPDTFLSRDVRDILATLVHEMLHIWQHEYGKPSRNGYHNREFAMKMLALGLIASHNGKPRGRPTGPQISQYIQPGGPFERICAEFIKDRTHFDWGTSQLVLSNKGKSLGKRKFTCPTCGQNAWARPSAHLICGDCHEPMLNEG